MSRYTILNKYTAHIMTHEDKPQFLYENFLKGQEINGRLVKDGAFYNFVESTMTHVGVNPNDFKMNVSDLFKECVAFLKKNAKKSSKNSWTYYFPIKPNVSLWGDHVSFCCEGVGYIKIMSRGKCYKFYSDDVEKLTRMTKLREVAVALGIL